MTYRPIYRDAIELLMLKHASYFDHMSWPMPNSEQWADMVEDWVTALGERHCSPKKAEKALRAIRLDPPSFKTDHLPRLLKIVDAEDVKPDRDCREWIMGHIQRDAKKILEKCGYQAYLETAWWQFKRANALDRHGRKCRVCGLDQNIQVHHITYENLCEETPDDLTPLCGDCHAIFHGQGKLKQLPFEVKP